VESKILIDTATGSFQRDLFSTPRINVYGTVGGGYIRSNVTLTASCCIEPFVTKARTSVVLFGPGVRVPLRKNLGIRGELKLC